MIFKMWRGWVRGQFEWFQRESTYVQARIDDLNGRMDTLREDHKEHRENLREQRAILERENDQLRERLRILEQRVTNVDGWVHASLVKDGVAAGDSSFVPAPYGEQNPDDIAAREKAFGQLLDHPLGDIPYTVEELITDSEPGVSDGESDGRT